jgi:hypothetical protein
VYQIAPNFARVFSAAVRPCTVRRANRISDPHTQIIFDNVATHGSPLRAPTAIASLQRSSTCAGSAAKASRVAETLFARQN